MKNLAGDPNCNADIERELREAGITVVSETPDGRSEVPWKLVGTLRGWRFERAWYYYRARSFANPLPMEAAEALHEKHGQEVRVEGHCACPSPREWWGENGRATSYHVDTQEGLKALADTIRENIPE